MAVYFMENIGTILITILLILTVALIIRSMIRDRKKNRSVCPGGCAGCGMCAHGGKAVKNSK